MQSKKFNLTNDLNKKSLRDNLYVFLHRNKNQYLNLIIKVRTTIKNKSSILSLTKTVYLDLHNIEQIMKYKNYVLAQFESKLEHYKSLRFTGLYFEYNILTKDIYESNKDNNPWIPTKVNIKEFNFPLTVNYVELAKTVNNTPLLTYYSGCFGFKDAQDTEFNVSNILDIDKTAIYLVNLTMNGKNYSFTDSVNKESGIITRKFTDGTEINSNNLFKLSPINLNTQLTPKKTLDMLQDELKNNWKAPKFIACTLDCETWLDEKLIQHLMSVAIYNGRKEYFFFIKDYNSEFEMVKEVLITLLNFKNTNVYIHNGARFDLIFLLKHFVAVKNELNIEFDVIYKDGELLDLRIFKENSSISIKDSLKLLLTGLGKLAKTFDLDTPKGTFPYDFAKPSNFDYVGMTPEYKYFAFNGKSLLAKDEYTKLIKNNWNFRKELMKYNINDCIVLYNVMSKFYYLIIDTFGVDMKYNPTLSSLALSIYRVGFIPSHLLMVERTISTNTETNVETVRYKLESKIDTLSNKIDSFIREGYFGGHVDAYIPHFDNSLPQWKDQILYHYDVISLYPSVMRNSDLPYKVKYYYTGNLLANNPDLFELWLGFHRVKVNCPHDLVNPILPYRSNKGVVMYPTGSWSGVYFSEEIKNAIKFGYTFEFLEGYIFLGDTGVYQDYIEKLFRIKSESIKGSPMYLIGKMLMNSLAGKFGIHQDLPNFKILNKSEISFFLNKFKDRLVQDEIIINENYSLINFNGDNTSPETNVALASSITSLSRNLMSQVKNNPNIKLFYTDTDSAFTNNPLPNNLVGNNLGQFALENKFVKFICLGPKIYGGITTEGKEIIKVKGLAKESLPTYSQLESLLDKGRQLTSMNMKTFKSLVDSIFLRYHSYVLQPTSQKRDYIYSGNRVVGTKNKHINE